MSLHHALNISWNKPFKERYTALWNDWSVSGQRHMLLQVILEPLLIYAFTGSRNLGHSSPEKPYYNLSSVWE